MSQSTKQPHHSQDDDIQEEEQQEKVHQPFDGLFKQFMSTPEQAKDFFSMYLPEKVWAMVNQDVMVLCPQSMIDNKLKHKHVDVLYRTQFEGQDGYIYILSEQQTEPDKNMPLRMMHYMLRIIDLHQAQFNTDTYPLIYPQIFYVGKKPYNYSTSFLEGFGSNQALAKRILTEPFPLLSVVGTTAQDIKEHPYAGVLARVYEIAQARNNYIEQLKELQTDFYRFDTEGCSELVLAMLHFLLSRIEQGNADSLIETIQDMVTPKTQGNIMTLKQQLVHEGKIRGIEQGIAQGRVACKFEIAKELLAHGVEHNVIAKSAKLSLKEVMDLDNAMTRH